MRAYFFVMVGCLILGVLTVFGYVLFGEQRSSDADKPTIVDEPAGTKSVPQPEEVAECESDSDCDLGLECFRGMCSYPCRGALMCPVGRLCDDQTGYCIRDLSGRWRRESDGLETEVTMESIPPNVFCPDTRLSARGFYPAGVLCLEADESLTLCKTHAIECGEGSAEGFVLDNGGRVEFTTYPNGISDVYIYSP
jgi:hypothetical protein